METPFTGPRPPGRGEPERIETAPPHSATVSIPAGKFKLTGILTVPANALGLVLFAHGSGSGRLSPRNQYVASVLNEAGLATLLADLLTAEEDALDAHTRAFRFDIALLAKRMSDITVWSSGNPLTKSLSMAYFGASTGAAAALVSAARHPASIRAVVSRGGRPDLAAGLLPLVRAPTLLIVGDRDPEVLQLNRQALEKLNDDSRLDIVPGATHLFEEPGALESVARLSADWFVKHMSS
ncbi:MAG: alpha/beta hydrolase [Alphaproteobacteria bacterium]|nr:MAG: alpha/beta hydrolase [Alphaproteobacteria bacterium]